MIIYDNKRYFKYSELSFPEKQIYYEYIYQFVKRLAWEYPDFIQWYKKLFLTNRELCSDREIIICESDYVLAGLAILKSNQFEKKICTLRVDKKFQCQGIGTKLVGLSLEWLEDDYPIITMHKTKQKEFSTLLRYYGFKLEQTQNHYYNIFSTELVYNGFLPEKSLFFNRIEILDIRKLYDRFLKTGQNNFNDFAESCIFTWYLRENNRIRMMKT